MSTVDLDAIRDLAARYVDTPWDGEEGADLACDLAVEVPALVAEVERLRANQANLRTLAEQWQREDEGWGVAAKYGRLLASELRAAVSTIDAPMEDG